MMIRLGCTIALAVLMTLVAGAPTAGAAGARIVGGEKVARSTFDSTYSSVVSIQLDRSGGNARTRMPILYSHVCGGTVIAPTLVLTAAHCVAVDAPTADGTGYSVLPHRLSLAGRSTSGAVEVEAVFVHPRFGGTGNPYSFYFGGQVSSAWDVAVLRLAAPIDGVTPVPLVQAGEDAAVWGDGLGRVSGAVALGWGQTHAPGYGLGRRGTDLRSVALAIRADRRCERSDDGLGSDATGFDADSMLCAGTADGPSKGNSAKATCFGDSGGPLFAPAADGTLRVVGISSWTPSFAPCATWSVFARVETLRDWIASIPAQGSGVGGIDGPDTLTATPVDTNSLRISWSAPATGTPERYRIYRSASAGNSFRYGFLGGLPTGNGLALAGITDAVDRSIVLDGIAPRRPGARRTHTIRIDAQDADGNRGPGAAVTVNAPIDAKRPTTPGTPNIRPTRRGTYIGFTPATDGDCIGRYVVQVRGDAGWRNLTTWRNQSCDARYLLPSFGYGFWGSFSRTFDVRALKFPLRGLGAGTWRIRLIASDRAGNSSTSRSRVFELDEAIRGGRYGTCIGSAGSTFCSSGSGGAAAGGVQVIIR